MQCGGTVEELDRDWYALIFGVVAGSNTPYTINTELDAGGLVCLMESSIRSTDSLLAYFHNLHLSTSFYCDAIVQLWTPFICGLCSLPSDSSFIGREVASGDDPTRLYADDPPRAPFAFLRQTPAT